MKKVLSLVVIMVMCLSITVLADNDILIAPNPNAVTFVDMPNDWSTVALQKAVDNKLIKGYEQEDGTYIKASGNITRAELVTILNRVFNTIEEANISTVQDVKSNDWYANDIAKAIKMGAMMIDTNVRPNDNITRQEAFTMLARAFNLSSENTSVIEKFTDKDQIADWATKAICALVEKGYAQGYDNKINPNDNITRAEAATIITNMVEQYIQNKDEYTLTNEGNVIVNVPDVVIENSTIKGDLIIADGVGQGDVTINNTQIDSRLLVRGGGENSVKITGTSKITSVIIAKTANEGIRIVADDTATVETVTVDNANDNVIIEGTITSLIITNDDANITIKNAQIENVTIESTNVQIETDKNSTIETVTVNGSDSTIKGDATITTVDVNANNTNVEIEDAKVVVSEGVEGTTAFDEKIEGGNETIATPSEETSGGAGGTGGGNVVLTPTVTIKINNDTCELSKNINLKTSDLKGIIAVNNQKYTLKINKSPTSINSSSSLSDMVDLLIDLDSVLVTLTDVINEVNNPSLIITELGKLKTWIEGSSYNNVYADAIGVVITQLQANDNFMSGNQIAKSDLYDILQAVLQDNDVSSGDSVYDIATAILPALKSAGLSVDEVWSDIIAILNEYIPTV